MRINKYSYRSDLLFILNEMKLGARDLYNSLNSSRYRLIYIAQSYNNILILPIGV